MSDLWPGGVVICSYGSDGSACVACRGSTCVGNKGYASGADSDERTKSTGNHVDLS